MTFDFSHFPVLMSERLHLRQLTADDAPTIWAMYGDPAVLRFSSQAPMESLDKASAFIERLNREYQEQKSVDWAIVTRENGVMIGQCGAYEWNAADRKITIGYTFMPSAWGQGYATEAARAMVGWCFEHLGAHRVQADCTEGHIASERVLLKCGFVVEGVWRESCWEHERFVNVKQFGLLHREYITQTTR